jgi:hypothetical protein
MNLPSNPARRACLARLAQLGLGLAAAAAAGPLAGCGGPAPPDPETLLRALAEGLADRQAAARLGEALRRARPELADREATLRQLFGPSRWRDVRAADAPARLREQVRDDFAHGRTFSLQGWLLAVSEARLYALLAPAALRSPRP